MTNTTPCSRILRGAAALAMLAAGHALAAPTANGRIVYGNNSTTPQQNPYTASTNAFTTPATGAGAAAAANPTYVVDRAAPSRSEHIAGYVTTGGVLYVLRWNGTAWSNEWNVTVGGAGANGRRFDIAYESTTGNAVVVYSNNVNSQLRYNVWNGTAWSYTTTTAPTVTSARLTGIPNWIKLSPRNATGTNSIALAVADTASDLSALLWTGSAWGNEPTAALSTTLQFSTVAGDKDAFDVAYENQSGDVFLVYSETTPANSYRTFTASTSTWSGALVLSATGRTIISMFAVADPDPASNRVVAGWDRTASANRYAVVWDGATLGTATTIGNNANATSPPTTSHQMSGAWLTSGASKRAVVVYQSTTTTNVDYAYYDVTAGTWTVTQASTGYTSGDKRWVDMAVDPQSADTLMLTYSDANSDLWAKRLVYNGTTLTWANADGGAALVATLTNVTSQGFDFAYDRYAATNTITIAPGTPAAPTATIYQGGVAPLNDFTLQTNTGTATVTAIGVNLTLQTAANVASVSIQDTSACTGGTTYGTLPAPASGANTISLTTNITATATATSYWLCAAAAATVAASSTNTGAVTGLTTSTSGYGGTGSSAAQGTVTIAPASTITISAATPAAGSATIGQGQVAALNAFQFQTSTGSATVTSVRTTLTLSSAANVASVSIQSTSGCSGGTTYGTLPAPVSGSNTIGLTTNITATATATTYYLCLTAAATVSASSTATGSVDGAATSTVGYVVGGSSAAQGTVTINPPSQIQIAAGAPSTAAIIGAGQVADLNTFTLQTNLGSATVTAVQVNLPTIANVASVSIQSTGACSGGTTYGTLSTLVPNANTVNLTTNITATGTAATYYLCLTATATVTAASSITGSVMGASTSTAGYSVTGSSSAQGTITISPPAIVIGPAAPPAQSTNIFGGQSAALNAFTLATTTGSATVTAIQASLLSNTNLASISIQSTSACSGGTTYGQLASPGMSATVNLTTNITATTGGGTYYLCATAIATVTVASTTNGAVIGASTSTAGYSVSGSSAAQGSVTINPPGATITVANGTMPAGTGVAAGSSGTPIASIALTPANGSVTIDKIAVSNTLSGGAAGTMLPTADVSSLTLWNGTTYLGTSFYNSASTPPHYEFRNLGLAISAATTLTVQLNLNVGATAARTFALQITVPTDVTVVAPAQVNAGANVQGNTFTVSATAIPVAGSTSTTAPMVAIINPLNGGTVSLTPTTNTPASAFKVQIRVFNPGATGITGVTSVALATNGASATPTFNVPTSPNHAYDTTKNSVVVATVYEATVSTLTPGNYTLRAQAVGTSSVMSEPVSIVVAPAGTGTGTLLVRDSSSQICNDCHAVQTHGSEAVGTKYGSWVANCRDCHSPHGTRNVALVNETVTPPSAAGAFQAAKNVGFVKMGTGSGDSTLPGWDGTNKRPTATGSFVNSDMTGPCQVCHTRTANPSTLVPRWRNTGNSDTGHYAAATTQPCSNCHSHTSGFAASCTGCHGTAGRASPPAEAPPNDSCGNTTSGTSIIAGTLNRVGAHAKHLAGGTFSNGVACSDCHTDPPSRAGHPDSILCTTSNTANRAQFTWSTLATGALYGWSATIVPSYNYTNQSCTNYCHGNFTNGNNNAPTWNSTVACGSCHGTSATTPQPGGTHPTLVSGVDRCQDCHGGTYNFTVGTACTGTCTDPVLHINGKMDADCTGCHATAKGTRRAIVPEFTTAGNWSHKRSGAYTVSKWDCVVCHMEGDPATADRTTLHQNGVINLRDPDTGQNIKGVTFTAASGASPGFYSATAADVAFTSFSRNLAVSLEADPQWLTIAAIMVNQCLKCHDTNGAQAFLPGNPLNPLVAQIGASPEKPFGTTIAGAGYTNAALYPGSTLQGITANGVAGGVVDVNESFKTTNSSYHPISGKQNNSYASGARMAAPWSMTKTAGSTNSWGFLISCWDCHARPTDTTITDTVTAHGGTTTLRGGAYAAGAPTTNAQVSLCVTCHAQYDTLSGSNHGAGSAFSSSGNSGMQSSLRYMCNKCHGGWYSATNNTFEIRPKRAQDGHGVNWLPVTNQAPLATGRWGGASTGTPATVNRRPYAFIRNTLIIGNHQPKQVGATVYTPGCSDPTTLFTGCDSMSTYTVGGTY